MYLERIAEWYLTKRRGRAVLPRAFRGMAIGCGYACKIAADTFMVQLTPGSHLIALNHSTITTAEPESREP